MACNKLLKSCAMPDGGSITIETNNVQVDQDTYMTFPVADPGRYVLISITDTGCGMDKETLPKIFDPFFTTKDVGEGTGLGLSMVYGLVKQHNGILHTYSEVDKGTVFKVYIPLVEHTATTVVARGKGEPLGGTETVLLAEDDAVVLGMVKAMLEAKGYFVLTAVDGEEALRVFAEHVGQIHLVLLDVIMPKLGGRAVYEQLREKHPQLRFLFSSGYSMSAIHTNFVLDDGLVLLQKPFNRDDLWHTVRKVLDN